MGNSLVSDEHFTRALSMPAPVCRQDFFLKYLASTWAVVLIIGPFFGGHLRPEDTLQGRAAMLSNMRYHTSVIIALFSALGVLGSSGKKLMRLGAYADRIAETERAVRAIAHSTDEGGSRPAPCMPESQSPVEGCHLEPPNVVTGVRDTGELRRLGA